MSLQGRLVCEMRCRRCVSGIPLPAKPPSTSAQSVFERLLSVQRQSQPLLFGNAFFAAPRGVSIVAHPHVCMSSSVVGRRQLCASST